MGGGVNFCGGNKNSVRGSTEGGGVPDWGKESDF